MDIKTAFLNAPLMSEEDGGEASVVILKPPNILVKLGYVQPNSYWKALMVTYGLRMMNMGTRNKEAEKDAEKEAEKNEEKDAEKRIEKDAEGKRQKEKDEQGMNREVLEETLRMIVMMAMIKGSMAQEGEEEEVNGAFMVVCLATILPSFVGLWVLLRGLSKLCSRMMSREVGRQPEEEPELEEEEEVTRDEGRQHVQQIDSSEAEEIPSSSTAIVSRNSLRQRAGKGGGKGRAAIVAERVNHEPEPLVVINRWRQECSEIPRTGLAVFGTGREGVVHYDPRCTSLERDSRCFQKCAMCQMMEPNR